jgi:hypothetical protein
MIPVWNYGNWKVNGNTATSPADNSPGAIFQEWASTPIPSGAKTYFQFTVSGAAVQTALNVGFGVHGANVGNQNEHAEGQTIKPLTFMTVGYNGVVAANGNWIYDPQDNADWAKTHGAGTAAPNLWPNGTVIGVEVDRIDQTAQFIVNGQNWGGSFSIAGLGNATIYPMIFSWDKAGPQVTLNTNPSNVPAGYTALGSSSSSSSDTISATTGLDHPQPSFLALKPTHLSAGENTIIGSGATPGDLVQMTWRDAAGRTPWVTVTADAQGHFSGSVDVTPGAGIVYVREDGVTHPGFAGFVH